MKSAIRNLFATLPWGGRLVLFLYFIVYLVALAGGYTHSFNLYAIGGLFPAAVCKGEIWRCVTFAFLPNGLIDWAVSLFWLATLLSVLGRNWTSMEIVIYCLLTTLVGAALFVATQPNGTQPIFGCPAMIFGLLAAWDRLYGRERVVLLAFGEISVRTAAILVALLWVLLFVFCVGPMTLLTMLGGGAAGWLYLFVRGKSALNRHSRVLDSQRIARLEI
jgi:membrane associated rhomboid family serine protease